MDFTRRDVAKIALAGLPFMRALAANDSTFGGVRVGINTFSFRGLPLEEVIRQVSAASIGFMEMESTFIEPGSAMPAASLGPGTGAGRVPASARGMSPERRDALRKWRLSSPVADFQAIRKKMDAAGIVPYAYNIPINDTFTDEEIDAVFEMAHALGVQAMVTSTTLPMALRLAPFLERHKMRLGLHPSFMTPGADAIGSPESYRRAMTLSPNFGITLDLNLFAAWGPDPLTFIAEMRDRIVTLHAHDRKMSTGAFVPFGEGDVPIRDILLQAKREHHSYVVMIERMYSIEGSDTLTETRRSLEYFKRILSS